MARVSYEAAYPQIRLLPRSRNWWARLKGTPAECEHLDREVDWIATLVPDTLYLRGKASPRRELARPEVMLCRNCLVEVIRDELATFPGGVVGFEPDAESFSQYFFVASPDFEAAGLLPDVAAAIEKRLGCERELCRICSEPATWLWLSRNDVSSLDDFERIEQAPGEALCAEHGADRLCRSLQKIPEANVFYMNLPYGDAGAYLWI